MDRRPLTASLWLGLLALGGLLSGHVVSYFVVAPDAHVRADLLAATGHSSHGSFATVALAAVLAGLIGVASHAVRSRCGRRGSVISRPRIAGVLWALQTAGFFSLELWERGHGPSGIAELMHEPAFLIGLLAQVVVALVGTALVLLVNATVGALLRLFVLLGGGSEGPPFVIVTSFFPRASVASAAWNLRGPPSPAGSPS